MPTTVLVIDDDESIRATLRMLLELEGGYTVLEAADGGSAIEMLRTSPIGMVVLFDYLMPHMDGEALLALAERERWLTGRYAFVCMTVATHTQLPATMAALLAHYDVPFIAKPFNIDDVLAAVRQAERGLAHPPVRSVACTPGDLVSGHDA